MNVNPNFKIGSKTHLKPHSLSPQYLAEQHSCPLLGGSKDTFKIKFIFICFLFHSEAWCHVDLRSSCSMATECKGSANADKFIFFFKA